MANLPETASWDAGVYQLETTDPVLGGPNGKSNLPLKNLANRTAYLKAQVDSLSASKAPLASPALTGAPTAPTAAAGTNTAQIATTEFVKTAIASVISGGIVTSVAGKTGAVTLAVGDVSGAAPLASPAFTGTPSAPTQSNTDNSTKLATTAFVKSVVADINTGVTSVAGKTGAVTLAVSDISGAAPLASPALTGTPTAPTPTAGDSTTKIATTAFVSAAIVSAGGTTLTNADPAGETVGATAAVGTANTAARADHRHAMPAEASTTASGFMSAADKLKLDGIQAGAQSNTVTSVAGKTGAVTLAVSDVSGAAPLASPALTGAPTAPTPAAGTNTTQIATTAFVKAAIAAAPESVTSVAGKTGAVTLAVGDVLGAAPLASPALTGSPTAPTPTSGDSTTKIATTAFVSAAIVAAGGTTLTNSAPTEETVNATAAVGTANTAARADHRHAMPAEASITASGFMSAADKLKLDGIQAGAQSNTVTSVAGKTGAVTLAVGDVLGAAPLASPALTGAPTAPTPAAGTNTTQIATTAFVKAAIAAAPESVTSVAGKTGAVTLAVSDVSGAAPLASPALTGSPTAPTPATGLRSTAIATMQKFADEFASSNAPDGYQKLPSGLIIQWGTQSLNATAGTNNRVTYPIAFPTNVLSTLVVNGDTGTQPSAVIGVNALVGLDASGFNWRTNVTGLSRVFWISIGV